MRLVFIYNRIKNLMGRERIELVSKNTNYLYATERKIGGVEKKGHFLTKNRHEFLRIRQANIGENVYQMCL